MAIIQIGNYYGAIYQAERPVHMNPDGSAQATLTYKCSSSSSAAVIPAYLTPHPFYPSLKCYESDSDLEPGGIVRITSIYRGILANNPEELAQFEAARTLTEAPIETHPTFALPRDAPPVTPQDLAVIELALQNCTTPTGLGEVPMLLWTKKVRGVESYLKPGVVFRKTYCKETIPSGALLEQVGKIVTPGSPAPAAPANQNYLMIGLSWSKQAGVVTVSEEYQLSGPGGWDPDLYPEA